MNRSGLYFPFIHIRDDKWLKAAALYWPSVRRLVPAGYIKHDSSTASAFAEAGVLLDEDPQDLMGESSRDLLFALQRNRSVLGEKYGVQQAYAQWDGRDWVQG